MGRSKALLEHKLFASGRLLNEESLSPPQLSEMSSPLSSPSSPSSPSGRVMFETPNSSNLLNRGGSSKAKKRRAMQKLASKRMFMTPDGEEGIEVPQLSPQAVQSQLALGSDATASREKELLAPESPATPAPRLSVDTAAAPSAEPSATLSPFALALVKARAAKSGRRLSTADNILLTHGSKDAVFQSMIVHLIFIIFFSALSMRDSVNSDLFFVGQNLKGQFEAEMNAEHAPTWGKSWHDVGTVQELYQWLQGPFIGAVVAQAPTTPDYSSVGFTLPIAARPKREAIIRRNTVLGAVRISQVRQLSSNCSDVSGAMQRATPSGVCFGFPDGINFGEFPLRSESKEPFGCYGAYNYSTTLNSSDVDPRWTAHGRDFPVFAPATATVNYNVTALPEESVKHQCGRGARGNRTHSWGPFLFGGRQGWDGRPLAQDLEAGKPTEIQAHNEAYVAAQRSRWMSSYYTRRWNHYPSPAYAILIDPTQGQEQALQIVRDLNESRYIDLQSRAVFLDVSFFNPGLKHIVSVRLVAELTKAGGLVTDIETQTVQMWEFTDAGDYFWFALTIVVCVFYIYFFFEVLGRIRRVGRKKFFSSGWSYFEIINFMTFCTFLFCRYLVFYVHDFGLYSKYIGEGSLDVAGPQYIDLLPAVWFKRFAQVLAGINIFLNWFKLLAVLSYVPSFGLMTETLGNSAKQVQGFAVIFLIIFVFFALAHTLVFHGQLESYKTIGDTMFTLLRSMLGDFDYNAQTEVEPVMGALLFSMYILVSFFVLLNIVIAIISDSYAEQRIYFEAASKAGSSFNLVTELLKTCLRCSRRICPACVDACDRKVGGDKVMEAIADMKREEKEKEDVINADRILAEWSGTDSETDDELNIIVSQQLEEKRKKQQGKDKKPKKAGLMSRVRDIMTGAAAHRPPEGVSSALRSTAFSVTVPPGHIGVSFAQVEERVYQQAQNSFKSDTRALRRAAGRWWFGARGVRKALRSGTLTNAAPSRTRLRFIKDIGGRPNPLSTASGGQLDAAVPTFLVAVDDCNVSHLAFDEALMVLKQAREQRRVLHFVKLELRQEKASGVSAEASKAKEEAEAADSKTAQEQEMRSMKEQTGQVLQRWYGAMKDHETKMEQTRADLNSVQAAVEETRGGIARAVARLEAALEQRDRERCINAGNVPGIGAQVTVDGLPAAMQISEV